MCAPVRWRLAESLHELFVGDEHFEVEKDWPYDQRALLRAGGSDSVVTIQPTDTTFLASRLA
jgi:hypothetical protein